MIRVYPGVLFFLSVSVFVSLPSLFVSLLRVRVCMYMCVVCVCV